MPGYNKRLTKTPRLLFITSDRSASTWYRLVSPAQALKRAGYIADHGDASSLTDLTLSGYDAVIASRLAHDLPRVLRSIQGVQRLGKKVFIDFDDLITDISEWNPAQADRDTITAIMAAADGLIVTNNVLAKAFRPYNPNIVVIPNRPALRSWPAAEKPAEIVIGLTGSPSHHRDWQLVVEPLKAIRAKYDVTFLLAGYAHPELMPLASSFLEWVDLELYPNLVNQITIGLCPLLDDHFNRCKSPIKAYELGMAGAAVIGSPTQYRTVLQGRGTLARTEAEWYDAIERYITQPELRAAHADALTKYISTLDIDRNVASIANAYADLYRAAKR